MSLAGGALCSQYHFRSPRLIFERQSLHMAPSHPDVRHAASEA
eukprot:COSAG01_NODE_39752_length_471_cov_1.871314_1_plen_42_part_10